LKFHYLKKFIQHYLTATLIDVLHSPFVFDLYQNTIEKQKYHSKFKAIENCRTNLLKNVEIVSYYDLGAGSNLLSTETEKVVKDLAKAHLKPARIAQIIHQIVLKYKYKNIIELGTSLGITASYIATAIKENYPLEETNFTTIEGIHDVRKVALKQFETLDLSKHVNSIEGSFNEKLDDVLNNYQSIDVFFVDGNHTYEATMDYFNKALPKAHNDSVFIFDDIYWSPGMTKAWEEIKQNNNVYQTVDLFFIGLVFFRTEQNRQHFKLRVF
jgi:predicted O-methyltransferase YrrM